MRWRRPDHAAAGGPASDLQGWGPVPQRGEGRAGDNAGGRPGRQRAGCLAVTHLLTRATAAPQPYHRALRAAGKARGAAPGAL